MTKQQEINVLRNAVTALGPDSYLGPWLQSNIAEIEADIRCDIFPSVSFSADLDGLRRAEALAKSNAKQLREDAERRGIELAEQAQRTAKRIIDEAHARVENITRSAVAACREAINNLTR